MRKIESQKRSREVEKGDVEAERDRGVVRER